MADTFSLKLDDVHKHFRSGPRKVEVLAGVDLELTAGDAIAITGPSGSGKSTLLHLLGTLDAPSSGTVEIGGRDPFALGERDLARFRNSTIGFIFQEHHLLPQYSVLENVLLPSLAFPGEADAEATRERALDLLDRVGLGHRLEHRPAELSGGERQRVAVARALINGPGLVLCDEPTGSLDRRNAEMVGELLHELHGQEETILVAVTHSMELAGTFERRFEIREGKLCSAD